MVRLIVATVLMSLGVILQFIARTEGYHLSELALLVEYVYYHIGTVILVTVSILMFSAFED